MNSRTLIFMSLVPLWALQEKCFPTLLSASPNSMSLRWWTNLSFSRSIVCPTYCMPHLVQVMAYTRLELRHDILLMQLNSSWVYSHLILPVLLSSGQYLQSLLLQKLYPLVRVPLSLDVDVVFVGVREVKEPLGLGPVAGLVLFCLRKLVIDACLSVVVGATVTIVGAVKVGTARTWSGSAYSSPCLDGNLAFTTRSLRFLALRYPHMSFFSCMNDVVVLFPSISQFENTRFLSV